VSKTVWTGSYYRARGLPKEIAWLSISRGRPEWWTVKLTTVWALCPSAALLERHKEDTSYDWRAAFRVELDAIDLDAVYAALPNECVLLCFESDWKSCHRKIVWEALKARFDVRGGEWDRRNELPQLDFLGLI
jgi:hypothetical protein